MEEKEQASGFRARLAKRQAETGSLVCVGIDPLEEKLPAPFIKRFGRATTEAMQLWLAEYVDATAPHTSLFKPQRAFYEGMEICDGIAVLRYIVAYIQYYYPDIPIFLDCKRGDILRTQERYGVAHLIQDGVDGMNICPYMGEDTMSALCGEEYKADSIVTVCYTSNESARETQEVLIHDGRQYWEYIAELSYEWAQKNAILANAGLVMAAAYERPKGSGKIYTRHLQRGREIVGNDMWFLIPGIGTQSGYVEETVRHAYAGPGSIAINSSSDLLFTKEPYDKAKASGEKARALKHQIREAVKALE